MSRAVYKILTDKVLEMINKGTAPWQRPWRAGGYRPQNPVSGTKYRGFNYLLLSYMQQANGWNNNWMTWNQCAERGGTVKDDQKDKFSLIFFYNFREVLDANDNVTGKIPFLKYFRVYNLSQIDGIEIAEETVTEIDTLDVAESIVNGYADKPEIRFNGNQACYIPVIDKINMPERNTFHTSEGYYATLFHELAHSTGHGSRLNRKEVTSPTYFGSHDYSLEELVAELTSLFLCDNCGITNDRGMENSAAYLRGWYSALKHNPTMFGTAASRAQKAADYILGIKAPTQD